mmetsp:Transcript_43664/g.87549  ORF Transcript_43664/g.87549 Transcript_43664/m.87549 type:complete len:166 (-) Transcript_43664:120-617(-)
MKFTFLFACFLVAFARAGATSSAVQSNFQLRGGSDDTACAQRLPRRVKSLTSQLNKALRQPSGLGDEAALLPDTSNEPLWPEPSRMGRSLDNATHGAGLVLEDKQERRAKDASAVDSASDDSSGGQRCAGCKLKFNGSWIMGFDRPHCSETCLRLTQKQMEVLEL